MLKEGQRVKARSVEIPGYITYIDWPNLYNDWIHPIQLRLDKPYDESGQTMYRTGIKDILVRKRG